MKKAVTNSQYSIQIQLKKEAVGAQFQEIEKPLQHLVKMALPTLENAYSSWLYLNLNKGNIAKWTLALRYIRTYPQFTHSQSTYLYTSYSHVMHIFSQIEHTGRPLVSGNYTLYPQLPPGMTPSRTSDLILQGKIKIEPHIPQKPH